MKSALAARPTISAIDGLKEVYIDLLRLGCVTEQHFTSAANIKSAYLSCLAVADRTSKLLPSINDVIREADELEARSIARPWVKSRHKEGLGQQQCEAFDQIHDWFFSGGSRSLLEGGAGTGKSHTLARVIRSIQELDDRGVRLRIAVTAPTHEAVKVMQRFILKNEITNVKVCTTHALLALKPGEFQANGKRPMVRSRGAIGEQFEDFHIVFIDECGMLNDEIMKLFPDTVPIVMMGDRCQLSPISDDGPADRKTDPPLSLSFNTKMRYELTDVHRYDGAIAETALSLRHSILFGGPYQIILGDNLSRRDARQWQDEFIQRVEAAESTRALLFTNAAVTGLNQAVRSALFPKAEKYTVGDRLRAKESVTKTLSQDEWRAYADSKGLAKGKPIADEETIIMATSAECEILDVGEVEVKLWHPLGLTETMTCYNLELLTDAGLKVSKTAVHCDDRDRAIQFLTAIRNGIYKQDPDKRRHHWRVYFELLSVLNLSSRPGTGKNGAARFFDRLQYGWAITTHQAQGATIDTVFVDLANMNQCPSPLGRKQLQYTALTRAAKDCYLKC